MHFQYHIKECSLRFLNKSQMYFTYSTVLLLDYLCLACWGTRGRSAWKYTAICNYTCGGQGE